jgi:hypothetical protein
MEPTMKPNDFSLGDDAADAGHDLPTEDTDASAGAKPIAKRPADEGRTFKTHRPEEGAIYPRALLDFAYDAAREGFVRTASMGAALNIMKRRLRDRWTAEKQESGYVFKEHVHPLDGYLRSQARHKRVHEGEQPKVPESDAVAAARKRWDEAKAAGDAGQMTIAANALLRAVEAERAASGEPAPVQIDGGRHPISEILAPEGDEHGKAIASEAARTVRNAVVATSDIVAPPTTPEDHGIANPEAASDAGFTNETGAAADSEANVERLPTTRFAEEVLHRAAAIVSRVPFEERFAVLRAFEHQFGSQDAARVVALLDPETRAGFEGKSDDEADATSSPEERTTKLGWWKDFWDFWASAWDSVTRGLEERPWERQPDAPWFRSAAQREENSWGNPNFAEFSMNRRRFRMPNNSDLPTVVDGVNFLIGTFAGEGADPVYARTGDSWIAGVRTGGSFRNDENGRGLILVDERGRDVTVGGKPRVYTWAELYTYGKMLQGLNESQWMRDFFNLQVRRIVSDPRFQAAAGVYDAAKELAGLPEDIFGVPRGERFVDRFLPEIPRDNSATGQTVRELARFLAGFIPIARGMHAAKWALTGVRGAANAIAAGAAADFLTAPMNGQIPINAIWRAIGLPETELNNYLDGRESDTALDRRLKNAVSGGALSAASAAVIAVLAKATRAAFRALREVDQAIEGAVDKATRTSPGYESGPERFPMPTGGPRGGPRETAVEVEFRSQQKGWSLADQYARASGNQRRLVEFGDGLTRGRRDVRFIDPGVKLRATTGEKQGRYRWDGGDFTDIVRGGFVVTRPEAADDIVTALAQRYDVIDKGWVRLPNGYMDRKILVRFEDGQVGEIQIWSQRMFAARDRTRGLYERKRTLVPKSAAYYREQSTLDGQTQIIFDEELGLEDAAWRPIIERAKSERPTPRLRKRE